MKKSIAFILPTPFHSRFNGYVAVPKEHPLHGLEMDEIWEKFNIEVNGGVTWAAKAGSLKNEPESVTEEMWVIGFDTIHSWDEDWMWPEDKVRVELENMKNQIDAL